MIKLHRISEDAWENAWWNQKIIGKYTYKIVTGSYTYKISKSSSAEHTAIVIK